jgi:hypothetical protein
MKKAIILLLTLCSSLFVNAQTFVTEFSSRIQDDKGSLNYIPNYIVNAGVPYFYSWDRNHSVSSTLINIYNEKFEDIGSFIINYYIEKENYVIGMLNYCRFNNYDNDINISFCVSQNFFNNDDHFEFVCPLIDKTNLHTEEYDWDNDGIIDSKSISGEYVGFVVFSDDGSEVFSYKINDGEKMNGSARFFILGGVSYFQVQKIKNGTDYYIEVYRIDKSTSSINLVKETKFKVNPTIADKSDVITVELDDDHQVREMSVVNAAGQVVKRVPVAPGQKYVSFSAQGMSQGVNIINAPEKGENNTQKIMVK